MDGLGRDVISCITKFLDFWSIRNLMISCKKIYHDTRENPGRLYMLATLTYCVECQSQSERLTHLEWYDSNRRCEKCGLVFSHSNNLKRHREKCKGLQICYKCWMFFYHGQHNIEQCHHYHGRNGRYKGAGRLYGYYTGALVPKPPDIQKTIVNYWHPKTIHCETCDAPNDEGYDKCSECSWPSNK